MAAAFILDVVYDVDKSLCGMVASEITRISKNAYRDFWYREFDKINSELMKYLKKNEHLYRL